jgi:hypothetical protein
MRSNVVSKTFEPLYIKGLEVSLHHAAHKGILCNIIHIYGLNCAT